MITEYMETADEAVQIARVALPLASLYNLPANPVNYAVLYEYVAEQNPELNQALEQLRLEPDALTSERIQSLYNTFVSFSDEQAIHDARQAIGKIIASTQGSLTQVGKESQVYQESLGATANQLTESGTPTNTADIIVNLIDKTICMQAASKTLQEELSKTNEDLVQFRTEFKRVRRESLIDPLTGIKNRRAFDYALDELREQAVNSNEPMCLLMVDIDHFKKVNDRHGHVIGDAVLKWVAEIIDHNVRGGDLLARYGGEEFSILLPNTPMEGAERVADNICNKVRNQVLSKSQAGADIGRVTVSIGVAAYYGREASEQFVGRADVALYRAKESGRNRVCVFS